MTLIANHGYYNIHVEKKIVATKYYTLTVLLFLSCKCTVINIAIYHFLY